MQEIKHIQAEYLANKSADLAVRKKYLTEEREDNESRSTQRQC